MRQIGQILVGLLFFASVAHAEPTDDAKNTQAKELYTAGMVHYQLEEYELAITSWEDGFRIKPAAEFLYNMAQAYRLTKRPEKALMFYQKYLYMNPRAVNRGEVERQIATLTRTIEEQRAASQPVPENTPKESKPAASEAKPEVAAPAPVVAPVPVLAPTANIVVAAEPAPRALLYKKWWLWTAVGGVVVVGVVIGVAIVASTPNNAARPPGAITVRF